MKNDDEELEVEEEDQTVSFSDMRNTLKECDITQNGRDDRMCWRYLKENHIRNKYTTLDQFYLMFKAFLVNKAHSRPIETLRMKMADKCNFWKLDALCGIAVEQEQALVDLDASTKKELDRLQRLARRLPTQVTEADTKERDWLFHRFDIGKTGRMVMAAADNMVHCRFGDVAYDVKDVIRASFRATKHVKQDDRAASAVQGSKDQNEDYNTDSELEKTEEGSILPTEFRLFLLALKAHLELFIAFQMIDSSRDCLLDFDEFCIALPLLKRWGVDVDDPEELFNMIDTDHSGTISFSEFTAWALKEAIISDLEFREKAAQNIRVGEEVLLHGKLKGVVGKVVGWDRETKQWIIEYIDPETGKKKKTKMKNTQFSKDAIVEEVLPPFKKKAVDWIEQLRKTIQPGTKHPWITEDPIRIKSEWSNRPGEYCYEIRAKMFDDELRGKAWGKSVKIAHEAAAKTLRKKITDHPKVKKVGKYVNTEVAKMRETEQSRKEELTSEKKAKIRTAKKYEASRWKKDAIGKRVADLTLFQRILTNCGVKMDNRESRVLFRFVSKGQAKLRITEFDDFIASSKNVTDKKVLRLRESMNAVIKMNKWSNWVSKLMAEGDQIQEYEAEFERNLKKKKKAGDESEVFSEQKRHPNNRVADSEDDEKALEATE